MSNANNNLVVAKRRADVLALRTDGLTYEEIAERVGLSENRVGEIVRSAVRENLMIAEDHAHELRNLADRRLERAIKALMPKVDEGDIKAIDSFVKVLTAHAKICGYQAPTQHKVDVRKIEEGVHTVVDAIVAIIPEEHAARVLDVVESKLSEISQDAVIDVEASAR